MTTDSTINSLDNEERNKFRIGVISFLNAVPLADGLENNPSVSVFSSTPSELSRKLKNNQLDVSLVPVVDFFTQRSEWEIACPFGIASLGPVWTVKIFSPIPFHHIDTLLVDADSHTSLALARVLFKLEGLRHPKFIHKKFSNTSAVSISQPTLLIGDKAWRTQYNGYIYDLGDLWNQKFRQPFVYAVWAGRKPINAGLCRWISSTAEKNLNRLDELARVHGTKHGFSSQEAEHYIQNVLHYRIEEAELSAMDAFFELIGSIEEPAVCRE